MGQNLTFGGSDTAAKGELYGVGFKIHVLVDRDSSITIDGEPYKERRLLNYLMLNSANVLMDVNYNSTTTEVVERHFTGFTDIGYNPDLENLGSHGGTMVNRVLRTIGDKCLRLLWQVDSFNNKMFFVL